ncbi:putative NAD-dependent epimerase/dehydratase, tetraketide alpha-pyrone reductase 1 [Helianthus annuus]|uniref:Dihydroflavonol 4-reductase n=1 Tax=Helianthus annuus TaxID=4232 RepID=A0A9K3DHE7_HELAN|nr:putative NAD-dependent epimerase/dehydratase, tetraketide alpha-pyrone reductase 1 [Helianthus annuus]
MEHGTVCVTGASGFLASWLIKRLLLSGYHVIGTVRDPGNEAKLAHLWNLQGAKERLRLVKAELTEEGSFDNAIMGCAGVFHMASPVLGHITDPREEIINPAVNGTLNVLRSCKKNPSLRRVVFTSSSSTVRVKDNIDSQIPLDESCWSSVEICERLKIWYVLSKTMAEKAAWEFCNENGINLVTVMPSFVVGPSLPPTLCSTASDILGLLKGEAQAQAQYLRTGRFWLYFFFINFVMKTGETERFYWHGRMGYVHIDDVALCHILVYEHDDAEGRYLCSSNVVDNNELVSILSARYPTLPIPKRYKICILRPPVVGVIFKTN